MDCVFLMIVILASLTIEYINIIYYIKLYLVVKIYEILHVLNVASK